MHSFDGVLPSVLSYYYTGGGGGRLCTSCTPADVALGVIGTTVFGYSASGNAGNGGKWVASFTGEAGATYHFDLCPGTPGTAGAANYDIDIKILNSACTILTGQDGSCTGGSSSYQPNDFTWVCPSAGTYYCTVAPYSSYASHTCTGTAANTHTLSYYKVAGGGPAPCFSAPNGEYPPGAVTPVCDGVPHDVSGCGFAGEYTTLNLTSGVNYIFTSSNAADWITISNNTGTVGYVYGLSPQSYTPTSSTTYRFFTHTSSACAAESVCRTRYVQCGSPPPPPPNNNCGVSPITLTVGANGYCPGGATAGTTVGATGGAAPYPSCLVAGLTDVWYSFLSGSNTSIQFNIVLGTMTARAIQVLTARAEARRCTAWVTCPVVPSRADRHALTSFGSSPQWLVRAPSPSACRPRPHHRRTMPARTRSS
ncbi:MAG: hypothetical protein IPI81_14705 [Flavobacteriales bacterium]|nr:hypothetical protein [Flavobacteriales bacterium]